RAVTRRDPGRVAIIDDGRAVTYEDLVGRSDAFARSLAGPSGVSQRDTVLALLGNSADFVALFLAVARLGAVMMPIDPALTDRELGAYLGRFAIRVAITTAAFRRQRPGALAGLGEAPWLAIEALGDGIDEPAPARRGGPFAGVVAAVSTSG